MKLGFNLTIEQTQKLSMTPELIQAIQILQLNAMELETYVQEELTQNPLLEATPYSDKDGENSLTGSTDGLNNMGERTISSNREAIQEERRREREARTERDERDEVLWQRFKEGVYEDLSYRQWQHSKDREEVSFDMFVSKEETLEEALMMQLTLSNLKGRDLKIGRYIVSALDNNGYLTVSLDSVAKHFGVETETAERVLDVIQTFEPVGVGARDIAECLIIQLASKGMLDDKIEKIVKNHLSDLAGNRLQHVAKAVGLTVAEVQEISDTIKSLEPKPGRFFYDGTGIKYAIPDMILEKRGDEYEISYNERTIPNLAVSPYYLKMLSDNKDDEEVTGYLVERRNAAQWLIKSIEQRRQTIYNVTRCIADYQRDFFEKGPEHLKAMTLSQVAEEVGIHESTVSRAVNGKYLQTPAGLYELKYFFSSGVSRGEESSISAKSIKHIIKDLIASENVKSPLSDQEIANRLADRHIDISRRTVAKYREGMGIASSSKRRRY